VKRKEGKNHSAPVDRREKKKSEEDLRKGVPAKLSLGCRKEHKHPHDWSKRAGLLKNVFGKRKEKGDECGATRNELKPSQKEKETEQRS